MPLDLKPIKARLANQWHESIDIVPYIESTTIYEDIDALIAEVERLRVDAWRRRLRDERPPIAT